MKVNYKRAMKKQQKTNLELVRSSSPTVKMREKLKREANRMQVSERAIFNLFRTSPTFRKIMASKANRQSVHEQTFWVALKATLGTEHVTKLPVAGKNAVYLEKGKMVAAEDKSPWNLSKSLDFKVEIAGNTFLICHKYTRQEGGSQDNQYADVQALLLQARGCQKAHVIAVCDGEYYNQDRMKNLKKHFTTKKVHVCKSEDLEDLIVNLC